MAVTRKRKVTRRKVPFKLHPRVFAALGADLVTNDVVAVIELVKNSYDAFATHVDIRFGEDDNGDRYLEIQDDGCGMDRRIIEDVWLMVATPYRQEHPVAKIGTKTRRVAGEKGLGRLAAARLGSTLEMITRRRNSPYIRVFLDWDALAQSSEVSPATAIVETIGNDSTLGASGTRIRVTGLKAEWEPEQIVDLENNLARLLSPFSRLDDFDISLTPPEGLGPIEHIRIKSPPFLSKPKYRISGHLDTNGTIHARYLYTPIRRGRKRSKPLTLTWPQVVKTSDELKRASGRTENRYEGGPFEFEIRAWDVGSDDTDEISEVFELQKSQVRKAIHAHKGISVYRDNILVLPKSEAARDWLGLDLRRISKVGTRLSTSQVVGYVGISKEHNPDIEDTSDRERLAHNNAVIAFQESLKAIVSLLENERDKDRQTPDDRERVRNVLKEVSAMKLVSDVSQMAEDDLAASDVLPIVQEHGRNLESVRSSLEKQLTFYSRMATIGTLAQMLIHEIRNRTLVFGRLLDLLGKFLKRHPDEKIERQLSLSNHAVDSLEKLADTFAPLASRNFRRRRKDTILEESIERVVEIASRDAKAQNVKIKMPKNSSTRVAVDPGELDAILLNLTTNALYWLHQTNSPVLQFDLKRIKRGGRVRVRVSDNGPGVSDTSPADVFLPGVTSKPGGFGMGLTIASELVGEYGGEMSLETPGRIGGATFGFDLPIFG